MSKDELVVDASVVINILGTCDPRSFLESVPARLLMPSEVAREVKRSPYDGKEAVGLLVPLMEGGYLEQVDLDAEAIEIFMDLVGAPIADSLHDGEAAVIACAATTGAGAVLDERKGRRVCRERFPKVPVFCTMDLFRMCHEQSGVDRGRVVDWLQCAIKNSRIRIPCEHKLWAETLLNPSERGVI
jgi:predicted nucleic acid-binding protein